MGLTIAIKKLIPNFSKGFINYFRDSTKSTGFGGPLNGSMTRQQLVSYLSKELPLEAFVETGSFKGTTTEFFSSFRVPVYSCELNRKHYGYSWARMLRYGHVQLFNKDSRMMLREIASQNSTPKKNCFFYLDAHWNEDLPLVEEISIIKKHWSNFVILIDDFCVPNDSGYAYDDYGEDKCLNLDILRKFGSELSIFFPAITSEDESPPKRGWCVLTDSKETADKIAKSGLVNLYAELANS